VELGGALKQLGDDAARVQVLFITVDPERDTPAVLARYVNYFDPGFLGLLGTMEQTKETAKAFKVFYQKEPGNTPGSYSVSHSAGTYLYDRAGRLRLFVKYGDGNRVFAHDIKLLLSE
jgi:protein SCO1/2